MQLVIIRLRRLGFVILAVLHLGMFLTAGGCTAVQNHDLAVKSLRSGQTYSQHFSESYCNQDPSGDLDVVLTGSAERPAGRPGTLKQVMHVHVLWQPGQTIKPDAAGTNASIRWYVYIGPSDRTELIEYAGTGRVALSCDVGTYAIRLCNVSLHPVFSHGTLSDPIGPSDCTGTIIAKTDRQRVERTLSEVRETMVATTLPPTAPEAQAAEARIPMAQ